MSYRQDTDKNSDTYKDEAITNAYTALSAAADNIVPLDIASVVTLYYYSEDLEDYTDTNTVKYNLYLSPWDNTKISSTKDEVYLAQTEEWGYNSYEFELVTDEDINKGYDNWYTVPVKVLAANDGKDGDGFLIQLGKATTQDGKTTHEALFANTGIITISYWANTSIYAAIANAEDGSVIAIKNGEMYSSIEDAEVITLDDLQALYNEASALQKEDYVEDENWNTFQSALTSAKAVLDNGESAEESEIRVAYKSLEAAMNSLVYSTSASIDVKKVALADDFITGADLSSYVSLRQSGVVFKDEKGKALSDSEFFEYLKEGGTNWVRIRVWNDPYNSNGDGYGGGNSDLDKAKIIGKLATAAGMRVLIDFHYSDFWADPSKQDAPKAWEAYSLEQKETAVYDYTLDSLNALKAAGVDVGMVQVGNETNNGICGEKGWDNMARIFSAGSRAVKYFNDNANADVAEDKKCLVAIHFADPSSSVFASYAKNLANKGVEYDVFAASYYPFWHGTADNMYKQLLDVAKTYGKKVMVAETSWVTTWEDGDGHGNTSPKTTQDLDYPVSVQGQADEMVDVISNVNKINETCQGLAIGVFYWEPAWISPYYVYNAGSRDESLYNKNKELWEKYGSGWASSYSAEYDPTDAGRWYGGSAVDNQAWFDFNGKALATAKMYSYIRTGASATERVNEIANVENEIIKQVNVGNDIPWPDSDDIVVTFNDGTKSTDKNGNTHLISTTIKWDEDQEALVNTDKAGTFTVDGTVLCKYYEVDGDADTIKSETYDICLTLEVLSTSNILQNPGFESADTSCWNTTLSETTQANITADPGNHHVERKDEDPHGGSWGWHFYSADEINFTIEQEVSDLKAGTYTVGGFIQGNGAASKDLQTLYVTVKSENGSKTTYESTCSLNGWLNWVNPEIANIKVSDGDTLTVGVEIESTVGGAWGTIDDMYMYGKYGIELGDIEHGTVNVSNMEPDSGEVVNIAAMPDNGYYLSELKLIGRNVNDKTSFKDTTKNPENVKYAGDAAYTAEGEDGVLTLTYNGTEDQSDKTMSAAFVMPEGMVTLQARFVEISFDSAVDISSEDVKVKGFTKSADGEYVCDAPQEYTGKKIELDLELTYKGYKLTNADYSAQYKDNMKTGKAEITIRAKGKKFTGSRKLYFNIVDNKVDISKAKAVLTGADDAAKDIYYYTGEEIEPGIENTLKDKTGSPLKTKDGTADLTLDSSDYTIDYQKNIKVGKATMTVIANSDSSKIKGSFTQTFTIAKRPITDSKITISAPAGATYTGSKITPNVTIKFGNKVLKNGTDYTLTYKNNVKVSEVEGVSVADTLKPSIKITGKGSYTGSTDTYNGEKITFKISAKNISDYGINVTADDIAEGKVPKITLRDGKKTLVLNKQYRVDEIVKEGETQPVFKYDESTRKVKPTAISAPGTYTATIKGIEKDGYTGTCSVEFRVIDKDHLLSSARIKVVPRSKPYTGSPVTLKAKTSESDETVAELEVTDSKGNALYYNKDYTISYNDVYGEATNIKAGKATVTITGKGNYAGTKSTKFTIAKNAVVKDANDEGKAVIEWEVQEDTILYKIQKNIEAIKKQDPSNTETLYLPYTGYNWTPELNIYATIAGSKKLLTKGKDYTITYKNNQKAGSNASVIIRGKGNYSGSVQFDNVFTVKDVTLDDFVITINPVEYNGGKALKPAINFVYKETGTVVNMKAGAAYAVKYINNKNVASIESATKPTVTITEKGLNAEKKGTAKKTENFYFTITTGRITAASVSEIRMQTYNGKPSKPALTIRVNGKTLKAGKDYVVTYEGNTRPNDKATARIIGIGNYSGTVNKTFVIK
ncbi:MAG: hypothetical protein HDR03_06315 [Lachnospiraceae bacterium]|nr:hypothetical protein [Lachnospiraceae bacterium]